MTTNREIRSQVKVLSKRQWRITRQEHKFGSNNWNTYYRIKVQGKKHFQPEKSYRKIICANWRIKRRKWFQSEIEKSRYKGTNKQLRSKNNTLEKNH